MTTTTMYVGRPQRLATVRNTAFDRVTAEVPGYREPWECGLVRRPNAAGVLPYDPAEGVYYLARQPRIGRLGAMTLECAAGVFDHPDDDPQGTAARELAEEFGLAAADYVPVAEGVHASPGYSDERLWLYLAKVTGVAPKRPIDGYITLVRLPLDTLAEHLAHYRRSAEADMKTLLLMQALHAHL